MTIRLSLIGTGPGIDGRTAQQLASRYDLDVVGLFNDADEAVAAADDGESDVAVLAFLRPYEEARRGCVAIREAYPRTPVVAVIPEAATAAATEAFIGGARGVVLAASGTDAIARAVAVVHQRQVYIDPTVASDVVNLAISGKRSKGPHGLTVQQIRVLQRIAQGKTNAEIAEELGIGSETVKTHVARILRKLDVDDRVKAVSVARKLGLL